MYTYGLGVTKNNERAYTLLRLSAFNQKSGGNFQAGSHLARIFLMNSDTEYYDKELGLKILHALSDEGDVKCQIYLGGYYVLESEKTPGNEELMLEGQKHFQRAATQHNHPGAHLVLYKIAQGSMGEDSNMIAKSLDGLVYSAETQHLHQEHAAMELAFYFKKSQQPNWETQYTKYLKIAANLGNLDALYFLGKAKMLGIGDAANYQEAKDLLIRAQKGGHKRANILIRDIEKRIEEHANLDNFIVPDNWIDKFLAIQSYSSADSYSFSAHGTGATSYSDEFTVQRDSDGFLSSKGTRYQKSGNQIIGSDGTHFSIGKDTIQNLSTGTLYRYSESSDSITGTNGTKYNFRGNNIYGTDGTVCTGFGKFVSCY